MVNSEQLRMALSRFVLYLDTPQETRLGEFVRVLWMMFVAAIIPAALVILILRLLGVNW